MDPRLESQLDLSGLQYSEDTDGDARVLFEFDGDRTQQVIVDSATDTIGPYEDRDVWSGVLAVEGVLDPSIAQTLLEENGSIKIGTFAIRGRAVVFKVDVPAQCTPDVLRTIIEVVAATAEAWEKRLAGESDRF